MTKENLEVDEEQSKYKEEAEKQHMRSLRLKHPDCVPVVFAKHKEAAKNLPEPSNSLMLFKKDLKVEQAMLRLYQQVQAKPLYFFCLGNHKGKVKYIRLKPGPTIQELFRRFGRNQSLLLIYADQGLGMNGVKKLEKCLLWVLGILAAIWAVLFGLSYFMGIPGTPETAGTEEQTQPSNQLQGNWSKSQWQEDIN